MTKQEAVRLFRYELEQLLNRYGTKDKPKIRQAWNVYTDMLCKDGEITQRQYDTWINPFDN